MAQRITTLLTDDLDGSPADETLTLLWAGSSYEVDLTSAHAASLREELEGFVQAARSLKTTPRRKQVTRRSTPDIVEVSPALNGATASQAEDADTSHMTLAPYIDEEGPSAVATDNPPPTEDASAPKTKARRPKTAIPTPPRVACSANVTYLRAEVAELLAVHAARGTVTTVRTWTGMVKTKPCQSRS